MSGRGGWHWWAVLVAMEAGLAVIPVKADGSKAPAIRQWKQYQREPPSMEEVSRWFSSRRTGIALVCGSGGLEMLEFEGRAIREGVLDDFLTLVHGAGLDGVWERISEGYIEESPSGGLHYFFTTTHPGRNQELARRPSTKEELAKKPKQKVQVLIETRGEGGYVIVAPSSGDVHDTKRPWRALQKSFLDIPELTAEERDEIYNVARSLDRTKPRVVRDGPSEGKYSGSIRPGDAYNEAPEAQERTLEILTRHGWEIAAERGFGFHLRRPDKDGGISATLGYCGPGVLYVFSTSTEFEAGSAYSPFAVLAELEHGGNFTAAAASLCKQGYGSPLGTGETEETGALRVRNASEVPPRRAKFTLGGRIFAGHLNIIAGIGGHNKSTATCEIAARASRGELDGDLEGRPLRVLIASAEDAAEEVIVPRLIAADAVLENIVLLDEPVSLPDGAERLRETIVENGVELIIVDPLVAFLESDVDTHRDGSVRTALVTLKEIGEDHGVTTIAVMHLNKSRADDIYGRLSGSVGFFNAARSVLVLTPDPRSPEGSLDRILWHAKCNAGRLAKPLELSLLPVQVEIGEGEFISTLRLNFGAEVQDDLTLRDGLSPNTEHISRRFEVDRWLQSEVSDGEVPRGQLQNCGDELGYTWKEILASIERLNFYVGPGGFGKGWVVRGRGNGDTTS